MPRRKGWTYTEEKILIDNYTKCTIKELEELLPNRNAESINSKIKRMKYAGKLERRKSPEAIARAYTQRNELQGD
jgi:hypothetical protein